METREHELIRQKIEAVTGLPEGYAPNLDSKWELLEAGLNPRRKKRPLVWISVVSSAAVLLMVSTLVMMNMQQQLPVREQGAVTVKEVAGTLNTEQRPVEKQEEKQKERPRRHKHMPVPVKEENTELVITASKPENITGEAPQETIAVVTQKVPRFVEMDFNEPVINNEVPSEAVIASQRFRFRVGLGGQSSTMAPASEDRALLRKKIN
jgi:cytoskeletal protein RodZ